MLELRKPTSRQSVAFGGVFAAFGAMPILGAIVTPNAPMVLWVVGGIFIVIGWAVASFTRGFTIDKRRRAVMTWSGLGRPMWKKHHELEASSHVHVSRETRGSGKNRTVVHPVRLGGVELIAPGDYYAARRLAEQTANHLQLGTRDDSSGALVVREAGSLDEPLSAQLRRDHGAISPPAEPPPRFEVVRTGQTTECVLPGPGFGLPHAMMRASRGRRLLEAPRRLRPTISKSSSSSIPSPRCSRPAAEVS